MEDYLKLIELEIKYRKAIKNTSLENPRFINKNKTVIISFILYNENNFPILLQKEFDEINELTAFIELLEQLKIIAQSKKYNVQLIPTGIPCSNFDIYINDELINPLYIKHYQEEATWNNHVKLREKIFNELKPTVNEIVYLYQLIIDKKTNIEKTIDIINLIRINPKEKKKLMKTIIKTLNNSTIIPSYIDKTYTIDLLKITEYAKKYLGNQDPNNKNKLLEQYNLIKDMIALGYNIETNYWDIEKQLTDEDIHILISFLNKLMEIIKKMQANACSLLVAVQSQIDNIKKQIDSNFSENFKVIETNCKEKLSLQTPIEEPTYVTYNKGHFNSQTNTIVFKDIQKQQLDNLTKEERDALIYYKTILYRPINAIISYVRKANITLDEAINNPIYFDQIISIILKKYEEYLERKKEIDKSPIPIPWKRNKNPKSVERLFKKYINQTPNKNEYINIVLSSIPLLESALSKIETKEDIIVYRGTTGIGLIDDQRFISTSLSLNIARNFSINNERENNKANTIYPNIIQIKIPKGSHIIAYTDDLFTDEYEEQGIFNEEQQEIIIDPINFSFHLEYVNTTLAPTGDMCIRTNYQAYPKQKKLQNKQKK